MGKKMRRKCFYALNYIMFFVFVLSASSLDGEGWIAEMLCLASIVYGMFANYLCEMAKSYRA